MIKKRILGGVRRGGWPFSLLLLLLLWPPLGVVEEQQPLLFAMVGDFTGETKSSNDALLLGLQAALADHPQIQLQVEDHTYRLDRAAIAVNKLLSDSRLLGMVANTDTAAIEANLLQIVDQGIPMIGFVSGSDHLRRATAVTSLNLRASFRQEVEAIVNAALTHGFAIEEFCAYIQDDAYGMSGLRAIRAVIAEQPGSEALTEGLDAVLAAPEGERNNLGPVGTYTRTTLVSRPGYDSLKGWEATQGSQCRLVLTVGVYSSLTKFIGYSRYRGEDWVVATLSTAGMESFAEAYQLFEMDDLIAWRVVMAQSVPVLETFRPVVRDAMRILGDDYGSYPLEGYLIGRFLVALVEAAAEQERLTPAGLLATAQGQRFDLGGFVVDFSAGNQGSNYVSLVTLTADGWRPMRVAQWAEWTR